MAASTGCSNMVEEECIHCQSSNHNRRLTTTGAVILGVCGAVFTTVYAVAAPFVIPAIRKICLPFVPATDQQVKNVMKLLNPLPRGRLLDIGSGDGRIVIEAAKQGFIAHGVELNPWLVLYSRWRAWRAGLHGQAKFYQKDLWKFNLSPYNTVVIFGVQQMMDPLQKKFEDELGNGSQVIACRFPLENWKESQTIGEGVDTVWCYICALNGVQSHFRKD